MQRRRFIQILGGTSMALLFRTNLSAAGLIPGNTVLLECLGRGAGRNRYVDGNTTNASVRLVPFRSRPLSGMWWKVVRAGEGVVALKCLGDIEGNRWLDGNTATGQVGLAPHTRRPFSGTRWQVVPRSPDNPAVFALKCLGEIESPKRWLDGNTGNGAVTLVEHTNPPLTGTWWRGGGIIDEG